MGREGRAINSWAAGCALSPRVVHDLALTLHCAETETGTRGPATRPLNHPPRPSSEARACATTSSWHSAAPSSASSSAARSSGVLPSVERRKRSNHPPASRVTGPPVRSLTAAIEWRIPIVPQALAAGRVAEALALAGEQAYRSARRTNRLLRIIEPRVYVLATSRDAGLLFLSMRLRRRFDREEHQNGENRLWNHLKGPFLCSTTA